MDASHLLYTLQLSPDIKAMLFGRVGLKSGALAQTPPTCLAASRCATLTPGETLRQVWSVLDPTISLPPGIRPPLELPLPAFFAEAISPGRGSRLLVPDTIAAESDLPVTILDPPLGGPLQLEFCLVPFNYAQKGSTRKVSVRIPRSSDIRRMQLLVRGDGYFQPGRCYAIHLEPLAYHRNERGPHHNLRGRYFASFTVLPRSAEPRELTVEQDDCGNRAKPTATLTTAAAVATSFIVAKSEWRLWYGTSESQNFFRPEQAFCLPYAMPGPRSLCFGTRIRSVCAGAGNFLALTTEGAVFGWGMNHCGELGLGDCEQRCHPEMVRTLMRANRTIIEVSVWCFLPFVVLSLQLQLMILQLSTSIRNYGYGGQAMALANTGEVYTWGAPKVLGLADAPDTPVLTPRVIESLSNKKICKVCSSLFAFLVADRAASIRCWRQRLPGLRSPSRASCTPGAWLTSAGTRTPRWCRRSWRPLTPPWLPSAAQHIPPVLSHWTAAPGAGALVTLHAFLLLLLRWLRTSRATRGTSILLCHPAWACFSLARDK
jgi:hypothetical protein